jgi:hypothetical protein
MMRPATLLTSATSPLAAAAHAFGEDMDFERDQRAIRAGARGRADEAAGLDIGQAGGRHRDDAQIGAECDRDGLAAGGAHRKRVAFQAKDRAVDAHRRWRLCPGRRREQRQREQPGRGDGQKMSSTVPHACPLACPVAWLG